MSRAIDLDPLSSDQFINRGNIFRSLGKFEDAARDYARGLLLTPEDVNGWSVFAGVLNRLERYDEAIAAADRAIEIDASSETAWYHKGNALFALGRFEDALAAYSHASGIYPNDRYSWTDRAKRFAEKGQEAEARKAREMAALIAVKKLNIRRCEKEIEKKSLARKISS